MQNNKGFTIIESLIAIVILSVGIFTTGAMQTNSIRANATANARSQAHAVALSFVEVLQEISFNNDHDAMKDTNGNKFDGLDDKPEVMNGPDYSVQEEDFQDDGIFAETLGEVYSVSGGFLTDGSGRQYEVFWNVADEETITDGNTKIIRLFVRWKSPMGDNKSIITFVKYNNTDIL